MPTSKTMDTLDIFYDGSSKYLSSAIYPQSQCQPKLKINVQSWYLYERIAINHYLTLSIISTQV